MRCRRANTYRAARNMVRLAVLLREQVELIWPTALDCFLRSQSKTSLDVQAIIVHNNALHTKTMGWLRLTVIDQTLPEGNCKIPRPPKTVSRCRCPIRRRRSRLFGKRLLEHLRRHATQVPEKLKIDSGPRIVSAVGSMSSPSSRGHLPSPLWLTGKRSTYYYC